MMTLDTSKFQLGLRKLREVSRLTSAQIVNQAALDVAVQAFKDTPMANRQKVFQELNQQRSTGVKVATIGKRKGKWLYRLAKSRELRARHLISNWWRGKQGKPGLYGSNTKRSRRTGKVGYMAAYSGKLQRSRVGGTGFLRSVFMPIIRALNPKAKYKVSFRGLFLGIKRWPNSAGDGVATFATRDRLQAVLSTKVKVHDGQDGKVAAMQRQAMQSALDWKAGKMLRQAEREFQAEFNKV